VLRDIDANFPHHLNRQRMHFWLGIHPRALHPEPIAGKLPEKSFGHLTAARIARA
jgi:hypothetical protein